MQRVYEYDGNKYLRYIRIFCSIDHSTFCDCNTLPSIPGHDIDSGPGDFSPIQ